MEGDSPEEAIDADDGAAPRSKKIEDALAIKVTTNAAPTKLRKLIDIKQHYLAELQAARLIDLWHVPSGGNAADALTKPMGLNGTAEVNRMFTLCAYARTDTPAAAAPAQRDRGTDRKQTSAH